MLLLKLFMLDLVYYWIKPNGQWITANPLNFWITNYEMKILWCGIAGIELSCKFPSCAMGSIWALFWFQKWLVQVHLKQQHFDNQFVGLNKLIGIYATNATDMRIQLFSWDYFDSSLDYSCWKVQFIKGL